ncbi:MAG: Flp pilus assembly complex ATPase component TadA [Elusimicrobia bacterium]|nr:Flp pilus assembly complex ATPase component TadA [Elusimicrobiota bacterium]
MGTDLKSADISKMHQALRLARDLLASQLEAAGEPAAREPYGAWLRRAEELDGRLPIDATAAEAGLEGLKGIFLEVDRAARGAARLVLDAELKGYPIKDAAQRGTDVEKILADLRPRLCDQELEKLLALSELPPPRQDEDRLSPHAILATELLSDAVRRQATSIHIVPGPSMILVYYRIAGEMRPFMELPLSAKNTIAAKLKIVAWLDITAKFPQDGDILPQREGCAGLPPARVRTLPTLHGERICVQLREGAAPSLKLGDLGLGAKDLTRYEAILKNGGLVLHAGLTESGRRTAIFSALKTLADRGRNVYGAVAYEPAYEVPGVSLTIAHGLNDSMSYGALLRSFGLRDPDAVGIDALHLHDTLEIALKLAAKGTLILASVHVPDAVGALRRVFDMGASPDLVRLALTGVCAHRLVRRLCLECRQSYRPSKEELAALGGNAAKLQRAAGCGKCQHTGYRGWVPVVELLIVDGALRSRLEAGATEQEWGELAARGGMMPWKTTLKERVLDGSTSLAEALTHGL